MTTSRAEYIAAALCVIGICGVIGSFLFRSFAPDGARWPLISVDFIAVSPSGRIATADSSQRGGNRRIQLYSQQGNFLGVVPVDARVKSIEFHGDNRLCLIGEDDKLYLFDVATGGVTVSELPCGFTPRPCDNKFGADWYYSSSIPTGHIYKMDPTGQCVVVVTDPYFLSFLNPLPMLLLAIFSAISVKCIRHWRQGEPH